MSLSHSLSDVGRPLTFYPRLGKFFGSLNAAIFFAQLYYWLERCDSDLGVYKTAEEWTEETGLSYREQASARKILRDLGILIETPKRLEHKIFYQIDIHKLDEKFEEWKEKNLVIQRTSLERRKRNSGSAFGAVPGDTKTQVGIYTEITKERVRELDPVDNSTSEGLPDWLDRAQWDAWHATRGRAKAGVEQKRVALEQLTRWREEGKDFALSLAYAATKGDKCLFPPDALKRWRVTYTLHPDASS